MTQHLCYFSSTEKFWKCSTRKLYAVHCPDRKDKRKLKRRAPRIDNSSDSEDFMPDVSVTKKRNCDVPSADFLARKEGINCIRSDIQYLYQIDKRMKVPLALYCKLAEVFKCNICQHSPITPVIFARCCKSIIGCQSCVDTR